MAQAGPQGNTTSIPKFTGFRGKQVSNPAPTAPSKNEEVYHAAAPAKPPAVLNQPGQKLDGRESRKRRHHRDKDDRHEHHRHKHKRRHIEENAETTQVTVEAWDNSPESFFIDGKGDSSNITYGSLHKYNIPSYVRNGRGGVLGLSKDYRIDRIASDERQVYANDTTLRQSGNRDKLIFKKLDKDESRVILVQASASAMQENGYNLDFVELPEKNLGRLSLRSALGTGEGLEALEDEMEDLYRYHEGRKIAENNSDHALGAGVQLPVESATSTKYKSETQMRLTRAKLAQKTIEQPADGRAWIDLINYEDELLYHGNNTESSRTSAAEKLSTADIKLTMYEKSLKTVVDPPFRERLVLGMLREGSKLLDSKKTTDKWHEALRENPGYISLWVEYLNFVQTNQIKFRGSDLQQCFKDCLQTLHRAAQTVKAGESAGNIYMLQAYVLLRSTLFLREAGRTDLSVGIWQAVLELNILRPPGYDSSRMEESSLKTSFEEFWESEVARIGEEGAAGWASFHVHGGDPLQSHIVNSEARLGQPSDFHMWAEHERFWTFRSRMPARTGDDEASDDPYRVIMYQDIAPCLVGMSDQDVLYYLVPAFLTFCHLPLPVYTSQQVRDWWVDPFVRNENLHPIKDQWKFWRRRSSLDQSTSEAVLVGQNASETPHQIAFPISEFLASSDPLFSDKWFDAFRSWKLEFSDNKGPVEIDWVVRTLKAIVDSPIGNDELAEYLIALESITSPQTARKTAKAILKRRPTSLRLYNAYALIEYRLGNAEKANDILTSTILRIEHLPIASRHEVVLLWRTRVWITLNTEGENTAWDMLAAFSHNGLDSAQASNDGSVTTITAVLRAQKAMLAMRSDLLQPRPELAAVLSEMLCLMAYLDPRSQSTPLEAYLSSFVENTIDHPLPLPSLELLHQSRARLLYHHATHASPFRPSELRAVLAESIRLFPNNTMFLSLYAWNEARFRIDDRVRAIVRDVVTLRPSSSSSTSGTSSDIRTESISTHFFSIYTELSRSLTLGSNVHSIRAAFERAVDSASCGSKSAGLWKLYVLFELNEGGGDMGRAKTVFYRAVQAVPWAKEIYLLAFEELRELMGEEELKGLVEWMVDGRGLRVFGAEGLEGKSF